MKKNKGLIAALCVLLAVGVMYGFWLNSAAVGEYRDGETATESTQRFVTSDGIVYGEVSAVGEETLTIKLAALPTEEPGLKLTGREVAIRTKKGTVINGPHSAGVSGVEKDKIEEGDIVSIALDEDGYAETITLINFSAVGAQENEDNG